jgi:hypothetical protein
MKTCKHCNKQVPESHQCPVAGREVNHSDEGDFLLSAIVGYETDSAILGALVGGDLLGGIVGEIFADS